MGLHKDPSNEELSLNKLLILYMLDSIDMPIANTIITEFILESGYTNYFSLQEYLSQMEDDKLIDKEEDSRKTLYTLTSIGKVTLELFHTRIPTHIKKMAKSYLHENKYELKNMVEIFADYIPQEDDEYAVHCIAKENNSILFELKLLVYDKETAINMCNKFKTSNHEIYKLLLLELSSEK